MFKKETIAHYIETGHRPDGGYSHTKEGPSSGLDTYLGTTALHGMGIKPRDPESLERFWADHEKAGHIQDVVSLYLAVGTLRELGVSAAAYSKYQQIPLDFLKNKKIADLSQTNEQLHLIDPKVDTMYLDVVEGELKYWYYVASTLHDLNVEYDKQIIIDEILSLLREDGGFGKTRSNIATSYYALKGLKLLGYPLSKLPPATTTYVKEQQRKVNYLEELHWAVGCCQSLGLKYGADDPDMSFALAFMQRCQIDGEGFAGSPDMARTSIEFTYYAVTVINFLDSIKPQWQ